MSKCEGCGSLLQSSDKNLIGYTSNIENNLCERCFRIRNYNEYKYVFKDNNDYIEILKNINKTNDLVILVVDLFNISKDLIKIKEYLDNKILLVLTKRDILPKSCYDKKLEDYFDLYNFNIADKEIISSKKNYNFDSLYEKINKYKTSRNVYVIGFTNSGKSTMINKLLYNYSTNKTSITTSNLPSTTIDSIEVKVDDNLTLIDTPGLLDKGDIINYIDSNLLKKIIPKSEIKPIIYQIKNPQSIYILDLVRIDIDNINDIVIYTGCNNEVNRIYKRKKDLTNLTKHKINVLADMDLVIQGLGFIKFKKNCEVTLYVKDGVSVYTRKGLI